MPSCSRRLTDGTLSIDYRFAANWLESLLFSPLNGDDYVLEIELPDTYAGELDVRSASGSISVFSALAVETLNLRTVSGKIDVSDIDSKNSVELRTTLRQRTRGRRSCRGGYDCAVRFRGMRIF